MKKLSIITVTLILLLITINYNLFQNLKEKQHELKSWVTHTHYVINETNLLIKSLIDAETSQRGYLLTLEKPYLEPYFTGKKQSIRNLEKLKSLTSDNPKQQKRLQDIELLVQDKLDELQLTIDLSKKDINESLAVVKNDSGKILMDKIRVIIDEFIAEEEMLLKNRQADEQKYESKYNNKILIFVIFELLLISFVLYLFTKKNSLLQEQLSRELEDNLEESLQRFEDLSTNISDWIWEVDVNGKYTYVSARVKDFLGYEPEEILGHTPFETMSQEEAQRVGEIFIEYVKEQKPFRDLQNVNLHKDGHEVVLQTSGFPIFDKTGNFIGYRGTDTDITQLSQLISDLQSSKENLNQAQQIANIGHWELDLVDNKLYWSDEVYRIFGLKPQEFGATYEAFLEYIHPDDIEKVNNAYTKSVENLSSYQIVHRVLTKQKDIKFVEERCTHELDNDGNVIKSIGTVHDITEKVKKDKELFLASNVFEYSTDSILITDAQNRIITVNKSFTKLTGYTLDEAKGENPRVLSSGWGDQEFYQNMWNDIQKKGLWRGEIWDRKKDGTLYIANQSIVAVKDRQGNIENYIGISHDITEAKNQEKEIRELAYYDFLTKLPNRQLFKEEVDNFIKASNYNRSQFALLFLDLDNFKWVNDTLGHKVGDKVLQYVSDLISQTLNKDSILGRLGGDEFVILIPYKEILSVSRYAQKIIDSVKTPFILDDKTINVGWSIGISIFPENGENYDELLKNSDLAMYAAKDKGKNNYQFFNNDMNSSAHKRMQLHNHLKYTTQRGGFELYYQPKVECATQKIVGAEALIRWNDKELGYIAPDIFIPLAEESGLILDIGSWVFVQAFKDMKRLSENSTNDFTLAINVSMQQLEDKDFLNNLNKLIEIHKVDPKRFELEITESLLMSNISEISNIIIELNKMGFSIAIDDFGTGYSSLQYLNKLSFHTLKIDREFVKDIDKGGNVITEAIMGLSNTLGISTVAEGVETKAQHQVLQEMGCEIMQGYLFSKPLPLEDFLEFMVEFKG